MWDENLVAEMIDEKSLFVISLNTLKNGLDPSLLIASFLGLVSICR